MQVSFNDGSDRMNTSLAQLNQNTTITVLADTEDATAKFGELQDQLDRLRNETADIAVKVYDSDADASLDDLRVRLTELGAQSEDIKVRVDTSTASADLEKLRADTDRVTDRWTAQGFDGAFGKIHRSGTGGWRGPLGHPVEGFRRGHERGELHLRRKRRVE